MLYKEISKKSISDKINLPKLLLKCVLLLVFDTLGYGFEGAVWAFNFDNYTTQLFYYILYTVLGIHFAAVTLLFYDFKALTVSSFKLNKKPLKQDDSTSQLLYYILYTMLGIHFAAITLLFFDFKELTVSSIKREIKLEKTESLGDILPHDTTTWVQRTL
ncbi:hypothetical protein HDV06_002928 [Boothiomyces sp. JEL0866]|nr:hypothetical protein HDV06_002928 [Boothiomyces sp. JEL0866]